MRDVLDFGCNAWLLNAGGIVSHYPSALDHQHPSPWLKDRPSGDLIGDAVAAARGSGVRFMARCDFSKLHHDQFEPRVGLCQCRGQRVRQIPAVVVVVDDDRDQR